jgi:hypothetical protein
MRTKCVNFNSSFSAGKALIIVQTILGVKLWQENQPEIRRYGRGRQPASPALRQK